MSMPLRLRHAIALTGLLLLPFACGKKAEVTPGDGTGGSGTDTTVCEDLFGEQCGRPCDTDHPCDTGMHCRAGKCHAECGAGHACSGGRSCSPSGMCSGVTPPTNEECETQTCADVGFACGMLVDECGNVVDCAEEGLSCNANQFCTGNPTECATGTIFEDCDVCDKIPDCSGESQFTVLRGRVVSPGRDDDDTANQVGIPNAVVYISRTTNPADLPAISAGLPSAGESCDRCDDQDYGPLLVGAVTDSSGYFEIEEYVPVDTEILLVVKAGKFRRATLVTVPAADACKTSALPVTLPANPARLPRSLDDGEAVNIPHIAVSTGRIDAMECVFHKMGLREDVFGAGGSDRPIHLYHGSDHNDGPAGGTWPNDDQHDSCEACDLCGTGTTTTANNCRSASCGDSTITARRDFLRDNCRGRACRNCAAASNNTSRTNNCGNSGAGDRTTFLDENSCSDYYDTRFLEAQPEIDKYDLVVFDCQGQLYDHAAASNGARRAQYGAAVRQYVNRGGRMFASHLSHTWLYENGDAAYSGSAPWETGLADVAQWEYQFGSTPNSGTGQVTLPSYWVDGESHWTADNTSPRIENFAEWMVEEGITSAAAEHKFSLVEPRSMCQMPGEHTEVFVDGVDSDNAVASRVQQFSFNTPYGAPEEAACGRVAYSGFHVAADGDGGSNPFEHSRFPAHCSGDLSDQEKVLLYMLFDLGACVGTDPPSIPCVPATCPTGACGFMPDGCGGVVNCGACVPTPIR